MVSDTGLVFWSRHRFDLAAELQVRVRYNVLPVCMRANLKADGEGWVMMRGFVIECRALRRPNGAGAFRVSLMLDTALVSSDRCGIRGRSGLFSGGRSGRLFGLN
jgi:hypothetical protein